jgi:uncharacterized protein
MRQFDPKTDFLGRGWSFPPTFERNSAQVVMVQDEIDIRQSLQILFSTALRERILLPAYGCTLQDYVFHPIGMPLFTELEDLIGNAILFFEPRIVVDSIEAAQDAEQLGRVNIAITYTIRRSNTRSNMVFPFYLSEGTNVRRIEQP